MPISDVLRTRSLGQSGVGGKVEGGALKQGGKVLVMPCGEIATIKAIEVDGKVCDILILKLCMQFFVDGILQMEADFHSCSSSVL